MACQACTVPLSTKHMAYFITCHCRYEALIREVLLGQHFPGIFFGSSVVHFINHQFMTHDFTTAVLCKGLQVGSIGFSVLSCHQQSDNGLLIGRSGRGVEDESNAAHGVCMHTHRIASLALSGCVPVSTEGMRTFPCCGVNQRMLFYC